MQKQKSWLIAAAILVVGLGGAMRVWELPHPPAGPYYDEAANGILAAGIANEGDRPLFITSYTGKEVLFFYVAALMIKLLGANLLALRLTSAILGTLTIAATLWCVWELFASQRREQKVAHPLGLALLTAGLLATSFWHLVLSRVGLRAVAQPLLQALTLAMLWRGLRSSRWWELVVAGVLCGLLGYTYLAARLFPVPLALALLTLLLADRVGRKRRLAQIAAFFAAAAVAFAPLGLYFLRNPERFAVRIEQVASQGPTLTLSQALSQALGIFFIAGDPLPRINLPGKPIFGPILAAAFLFGLALTLFRLVTERDPLDRARDVLLLAWIPSMILPTALTVADIVPHYLRAAGLLPLIYLFPALSIAWLLERMPRWANWKLWVTLGVLLVLTSLTTVRGYFVRLAQRTDHYEISDGDLADMAEWLNASESADSSRPETVYVASIHYRHPTLAFLAEEYDSFKWLTGGRTLVAPTQDSALVLVPRSTDYRWAQPYLSASANSEDCRGTEIPAGPDGVPAFDAYCLPPGTPLNVSHDLHADFSHVIRLEGYDLLQEPGVDQEVDIVLRWRVLNPPPSGDYHVFVHLLDAWGLPWGEKLPFQYPSAQWSSGELFLDRIRLKLSPGTPPGDYWLDVGLYSPEEDRNLTVVGADGAFAGTVSRIPVSLSAAAEPEPLAGIRQPLDVELVPGLRLLGVNLDTSETRTRGPIFLTLFWQAVTSLDDLEVRLSLGDRQLYQGAPVHNSYATSAWSAGEGVVDRYNSRVPLDTPDGEWPLTLSVLGREGASDPIELGRIQVIAPERSFSVPEMQNSLNMSLGDRVELLGYDVSGLDGPSIGLTLYWRTLEQMEKDYTVFVHLLAPDGALAGQADAMPREGTYPTSLWAAGEVITDQYQIPVTAGATLPLSLKVGIYLPTTGEQLGEVTLLE